MTPSIREQKELSQNERFRLEAEVQRIETERRIVQEEKSKIETELSLQKADNVRFKNELLEEQKKQIIKMAEAKQKIAAEWAELEKAKNSIFESLKPDAFLKYEQNIREAACKLSRLSVCRKHTVCLC